MKVGIFKRVKPISTKGSAKKGNTDYSKSGKNKGCSSCRKK